MPSINKLPRQQFLLVDPFRPDSLLHVNVLVQELGVVRDNLVLQRGNDGHCQSAPTPRLQSLREIKSSIAPMQIKIQV